MAFGFTRPTRSCHRPNWQRAMTLIVCVLSLPLPVPMVHRHDEIDSHGDLVCHLAERHQLSSSVRPVDAYAKQCSDGPALDEPHWHFVLPSQYRRHHASDHETPPTESALLASADSGAFAATISDGRLMELSASTGVVVGFRLEMLSDRFDIRNDCQQAADALQVSRCALGCVMRC